jgi:hypothetical protein
MPRRQNSLDHDSQRKRMRLQRNLFKEIHFKDIRDKDVVGAKAK